MAGPERDFDMLSLRRQTKAIGAEKAKADDLISTMIDDHEQAQRFGTRGRRVPRPSPAQRSASLPADPENPVTSLVSRLWRSKTVNEDMVILPPASLSIKQTHWKPTATASKCAAPTCRKPFTSVLGRRRNCAMCGLVFCRNCTNYSRRLSTNAQPDPLGQFHSVCQVCFNFHNAFSGSRDHMREFRTLRQARLDLISSNESVQDGLSLCSRRSTDGKQARMRREVKRLVEGYRANPGKIKELVGEMVVPEWQKSSDWVVSKDVQRCHNCGANFGLTKRKIHCRVGGQVFCSNCVADELILYIGDTGDVKWALNGKDGGPTKAPEKYRLLFVCSNCSSELQGMIVQQMTAPPPSVFLDSLDTLHTQLSKLQAKIETHLPSYKQLVDSMDAANCSPNHVKDRHPMRKLIKAHADLSDAFSSLAVESQRLKLLKPKSLIQEKLLRNVMMGMYRSYSDNMYSFRNLKNHLSELVPMETLTMIQEMLSQQSMERIHVVIQQLTLEALNFEHLYKFDNNFFTPIIAITKHMDLEFKEFVERRGECWESHNKVILMFIEEELKSNRRRIKIDGEVLRYRQPHVIHYLVVSQCSSLIHECYRELQAKTIDREFRLVKDSLYDACEKLDTILVTMNTIGV